MSLLSSQGLRDLFSRLGEGASASPEPEKAAAAAAAAAAAGSAAGAGAAGTPPGRPQRGTAAAAAAAAAASRELLFSLGDHVYAWDERAAALLRAESGRRRGDEGGLETLLCLDPPSFRVQRVLPSPSATSLVALVGSRGLVVMHLPPYPQAGTKDSCTNCRVTVVAERLFTSRSSLRLLDLSWFPEEGGTEPHVVLLTSDNMMRIYAVADPHTAVKVFSLTPDLEDSPSLPQSRSSFACALGERAVAFDFGLARPKQNEVPLVPGVPTMSNARTSRIAPPEETVFPIYVLYETGETYVVHTCLSGKSRTGDRVLGPLPMHPAAEDNYGYGACSLLCLRNSPSVLVIATETGTVYHCLLLEEAQTEDGLPYTLFVFDAVELELSLNLPSSSELEEQTLADFTCPIRLSRDPLCDMRYHCTHEAGVHSIAITWLPSIQTFVGSPGEEKSEDELTTLADDHPSVVEHVLCTRPSANMHGPAVQGVCIVRDLSMGAVILCLTSNYEVVTRPLLMFTWQPSALLIDQASTSHNGDEAEGSSVRVASHSFREESLEQRIHSILQRDTRNPILRCGSQAQLSQCECLQLVTRAVQVFREENILKLDLARDAILRRVRGMKQQKEKQMEDLKQISHQAQELRKTAECLVDKSEDARERQEALVERVHRVLRGVHACLPVLSDRERHARSEIQTITDQVEELQRSIEQVLNKRNYQQKKLIVRPNMEMQAQNVMTPKQISCVHRLLEKENRLIVDLVKKINQIKVQINV
ncbi:nuclear pore complex protein Nup88 isoform X1 [Petromyzon marinus]|uniref:nuclear pore complex protein Nup88 isoform X1 n=1 Tax=Petromyzon marinus TaxID=7757 RepID=UPI003F6FB137